MPREALTLWWVVFNDPQGCSDACGEDDIFVDGDPTKGINPDGLAAADIVVGYATGTVANRNGRATMTARLGTGAEVSEVLFGERRFSSRARMARSTSLRRATARHRRPRGRADRFVCGRLRRVPPAT